jgi:hypothetical protein
MKKKTYVYFLAPIVGLLIFSVIYWNYASDYDARIEAMEKKIRDERRAKIDEENAAKKKAVDEALVAQKERQRLKAEKEAKDAEEKEKRIQAAQLRDKTRIEASRLEDRAKDLAKEIEENKKEIEQIKQDQKSAVAEQNFLREYVKVAEANARNLEGVLEKIELANKAAEAAAKAAAAAKKQ